jgi:sulfite exporter TauE/SafE
MEFSYLNAFLVGLFSTLHCIGMCGGIIGAITFSLPQEIRESRWRLTPYISAYNLGRVTSYTLAGVIAGTLGQIFSDSFQQYGHLILQSLATLLMIAIGLYLAGWFPRFATVEQLGKPIWKKLEPISKKLLPVKSPYHAFLFGMVWGWLPCGLVYSALLWSTSGETPLNGALFMFLFGVGTLPTVMTAGILTGWFMRLHRLPYLRPIVGITIIILALATGYLGFEHAQHTEHQHVH